MLKFLSVIKAREFGERCDWFYKNLHSKRIEEAERRVLNNTGGLSNSIVVRIQVYQKLWYPEFSVIKLQ